MRNTYKLITLSIAIILASFAACTNNGPEENNNARPEDVQHYRSSGLIRNIDIANAKVTIDHEDIPGYMSAMEMSEPVSDPGMLAVVKPGDVVEFELQRTGSKILITKLSKTGEKALINSAEIYRINCAECHGARGEGAEKGIPFISGHALDHTEADFIKTVANGKSKNNTKDMPAFKEKLSADEIASVVKHVREVIQKDVVPVKGSGHHHH